MKLTPYFRDLIEMRWDEFTQAEQNTSITSTEATVHAIVRACVKGKLPAIRESLNRIDGKLAEEIEVEYPKFIILYPHAEVKESTAPHTVKVEGGEMAVPSTDATLAPAPDAPTNSLRDALKRLSAKPQQTAIDILEAALYIDEHKYETVKPHYENNPRVKSVIAAGLLTMASKGHLGAIFEVFDNIDGKLVDKIKVLGDDVYFNSYDTIAPSGAIKNKDGIYQIEADNTTNQWAVKLGRTDNETKRIAQG